jgi:hypothetical protein
MIIRILLVMVSVLTVWCIPIVTQEATQSQSLVNMTQTPVVLPVQPKPYDDSWDHMTIWETIGMILELIFIGFALFFVLMLYLMALGGHGGGGGGRLMTAGVTYMALRQVG